MAGNCQPVGDVLRRLKTRDYLTQADDGKLCMLERHRKTSIIFKPIQFIQFLVLPSSLISSDPK